jgi:hypothetical protein
VAVVDYLVGTAVAVTPMVDKNLASGAIAFTSDDARMTALPASFKSPPKSDANLFDPITGMLQGGSEMDWATWDKLVLQYHDPNNIPSGWPTDLDNFDFTAMPDFGPTAIDADLGAMTMPDDWGSMPLQSPFKGVPGAGVMPFAFNSGGGS